jgi:hypothetical protein
MFPESLSFHGFLLEFFRDSSSVVAAAEAVPGRGKPSLFTP